MFSRRTNWNLAPNRLARALERLRSRGGHPLDLTQSNPTESGFEYDRERILGALQDPRALRYAPDPKGSAAAREAVAAYYAERGAALWPEQIVLTTGTSEAYVFVFRLLCDPGDELLIPAPSYPMFDFLADLSDVRLARYGLVYDHGWRIDFGAVERAITASTRGIVVIHPNNPTGNYCGDSEMARLAELCAERGLGLIADEVFLDFAHSLETAPRSFAAGSRALGFTLSGISKICGLPQMKAGWIAVSGAEGARREALARLEVIADTMLSMNAPVQLALPVLLQTRRQFQPRMMHRLRSNLAELDRQLSGHHTCERLAIEGGWYAILRIPAVRDDEEAAIELLEKCGAYVHPGSFYDLPARGYLVLSLIVREADFAEGVRRVLSIF